MTEKSETIGEKMKRLDDLVAWFDGEDFQLEQAIEMFERANALASDIEEQLTAMKNEITVLERSFEDRSA